MVDWDGPHQMHPVDEVLFHSSSILAASGESKWSFEGRRGGIDGALKQIQGSLLHSSRCYHLLAGSTTSSIYDDNDHKFYYFDR